MNDNLNLIEMLKNCPKGTKLYSPLCGEVALDSVVDEDHMYYPIKVNRDGLQLTFARDGRFHRKFNGECMLFPSKNQRDWSKFIAPIEKFDYSTLNPFDKILVRGYDSDKWMCSLFSFMTETEMYCIAGGWHQGIPYNDETKHLVGSTDTPDEKYIWWEE